MSHSGTSITSVGGYAFRNCTSLTTIAIPGSVTIIFGANLAFSDSTNLNTITVDVLNPSFSSMDGVLFNKSRTTLVRYPEARVGSHYTISNGIASIGGSAFSSCPNLTTVTIAASVTSIGDLAFAACSSLRGLYFKGNAPSLGSFVFSGDSSVTIFYLPATAGWGATFGGLPTALWRPQVLTSDGNFGVRTNQLGFNLSCASGMNVAVDACTNLANSVWAPLHTNTLTADTLYFSDPQWTNHPARF